jgi:hypothetical protein
VHWKTQENTERLVFISVQKKIEDGEEAEKE